VEINGKYKVTIDNRIIYVVESDLGKLTREYTVWGICKKGFIHGAGSYIRRDELGVDYTIIGKPTNDEFERYYKLYEELKELFEDNDESEDWKDLLDDEDEDELI